MPRKSRIDAPGALHHIVVRGIDRKDIFHDQKDYALFMDRLGALITETRTSCYAWALIPNHFHLLLRTGNVPISVLMKRLLTGYAVNFNKRYNRSGHLFQNRYKSILCQEDTYLLELVRYIHLNPIRAGLVKEYKELSHYDYCGHAAIMGHKDLTWQDTAYVLGLFNTKSAYSRFVRSGIGQNRPDLTGGGLLRSHGGWTGVKLLRESGHYQKSDERILGDGQFVQEVLKRAEERFNEKYLLKIKGYDLPALITRIAALYQLTPDQITDGIRDVKRTSARSVLCYWATDKLGMTQSQLAHLLNRTPTAIVYAVRRGREIAKDNSYTIE